MNTDDPQKLKSPEAVSAFSRGSLDMGTGQSGTVYFNNANVQRSPEGPDQLIKTKIASGDTVEKRIKDLFESLLPEQK